MGLDKTSSERLSLLRFPLIVGVIFIHAYGTAVAYDNGATIVGGRHAGWLVGFVQDLVSQGVARIAVPLFFLMSGYFFFLGFAGSLAEYRKKFRARIQTLLIPFLFWNVAALLAFALVQALPATQGLFSEQTQPVAAFGFYDYLNAILGIDRFPISYQFWFIRDLMVMVLLTPVLWLVIRTLPNVFFWLVLGLWYFDVWPVYVPSVVAVAFFYAGAYFACSNISLFALDRFGIPILCSYSAILLMDVLIKAHGLNNYIHNAGLLLGVVSALVISKQLVKRDTLKKSLLWAGSCSFFVFAVHEPLLTILKKVAYMVFAPDSDGTILALYFSIPVVVIVAAMLIYVGMKWVAPGFLRVISGGR
jgi:surface polysaccharide O-acyltransferase-like enzyme